MLEALRAGNKSNMKINVICLFLLLSVSLALYFNALNAAWYYDDFDNIVYNKDILSLSHWIKNILSYRSVSYLTFSINYKLAGFSVEFFRLTNIFIHAITSFLVFLLLRRCYSEKVWPALFGSLIFVAHPVQTQAVTYIVQRMASLSALFELACIIFYIAARKEMLSRGNFTSPKHLLYYGLSFASAVLAGLSKENAATLPLVLILVDFLIIERGKKFNFSHLIYLSPFFVIPASFAYQQIIEKNSTLHKTSYMVFFFEAQNNGSPVAKFVKPESVRINFLITQFIVLWHYIKLFLFPIGQTLDYGYPLTTNLLNLKSLSGLISIAASLALGWRIRRQAPLVALGIFWFFLTISIESSVFPLDTIFEHRLYLPIFGLILITIELVFRLISPVPRYILLISAFTALSFLTVQRNALWADPVKFFKDNVSRSPHNFRPMSHLSNALIEQGRLKEALQYAEDASRLYPTARLFMNIANLQMKLGQKAEALKNFRTAALGSPESPLHNLNYSLALSSTGNYPLALVYAQKAFSLAPKDDSVLAQLGLCLMQTGKPSDAIGVLRQALAINPDNAAAKENLERSLEALKYRRDNK